MLIDHVLRDLDIPDPDERTGSPFRGSRLGECARRMAYSLYRDVFHPAPLPARAKLVFRFGHMIHDLVRAEFSRVLPGQWGLAESRFHYPIPLTVSETKHLLHHIAQGRLEAQVVHGLSLADLARLPLTINTADLTLWVPTHVDGIALLPEPYEMGAVEIKSMATGSFRRALEGKLDYGYRTQMAVAIAATKLDTQLYVTVRKDTCHLLEVVYTRKANAVAVTFTKSSLLMETARLALDDSESDWESAELQHPFEPKLLVDAQERVKRVIMSTPHALPAREYGPDFTCSTCGGVGIRMCRQCKGTKVTAKLKKPCGPCGGTGSVQCPKCVNGYRDEADLPWQCSYCAFVKPCWGDLYRLELTDRPRYIIPREAFLLSGIVVQSPEPMEAPQPEPEPEVVADTDLSESDGDPD